MWCVKKAAVSHARLTLALEIQSQILLIRFNTNTKNPIILFSANIFITTDNLLICIRDKKTSEETLVTFVM